MLMTRIDKSRVSQFSAGLKVQSGRSRVSTDGDLGGNFVMEAGPRRKVLSRSLACDGIGDGGRAFFRDGVVEGVRRCSPHS